MLCQQTTPEAVDALATLSAQQGVVQPGRVLRAAQNLAGWENDDGSLGAALDFHDMGSALNQLAATRPTPA